MACRNVNVHGLSKLVRYFSQKTTEQGKCKLEVSLTSVNNNFSSVRQNANNNTMFTVEIPNIAGR